MIYANVSDVEAGFRTLTGDEAERAATLVKEASVIVDAFNSTADGSRKALVVCNMVRRVLGDGQTYSVPMGATNGSMSALGYSQSWTMSSGSAGELYLSKLDKRLLGVSTAIGARSPLEGL